MLKSSSNSGQWMPYPPPAIFQLFSWPCEACRSRGYQASGTLMVLPSTNVTLRESAVKLTLDTRSSAFRTPGIRQFYRIANPFAQAYNTVVTPTPTTYGRDNPRLPGRCPEKCSGLRVLAETLGPPVLGKEPSTENV